MTTFSFPNLILNQLFINLTVWLCATYLLKDFVIRIVTINKPNKYALYITEITVDQKFIKIRSYYKKNQTIIKRSF